MNIQKQLLFLICLICITKVFPQQIHYVDKSSKVLDINGTSSKPYLSIGSAYCNSKPGDKLIVIEDTYQEHLVLDKPISLIANNGPVVIKGEEPLKGGTSFNEIFQKACHNCYETQYASSLKYALCSTNNLEIDIWDTSAFAGIKVEKNNQEWFVRHGMSGGNNNCCSGNKFFSDCLKEME